MILVTGDLHLDDNPTNEYRWQIFDAISQATREHEIDHILILGDFVDRKDRHSAAFVNRLLGSLMELDIPYFILRGNHDSPLRGPAYWEFLDQLGAGLISYVTKPEAHSSALLLPFTPRPKEDWKGLHLADYKAIFLHATPAGALAENGVKLTGSLLPLMPRSVKIYSGDVHTPQQIRNWVCVGAPHPVKFGDKYDCRMLILNENTYEIAKEIKLNPPRKVVLDISTINDLAKADVKAGDQVRINCNLAIKDVDEWNILQSRIAKWAEKGGINVVGTEIIVDTPLAQEEADLNLGAEQLLRDFAINEEVPDDLLTVGLELLKEVT